MSKLVIYQVLPRLFGNMNATKKPNGTMHENGCGKFENFSTVALQSIRSLGVTHIWYTGIIEHATRNDYTAYGIQKDHDVLVKGNAGSPYAIKDYYDVDPDLAVKVENRMDEFERLVRRTHEAGMKVIIDFVPNHVARQYHSDAKPKFVADLGEKDHPEWAFSPLNNFYYIPNKYFNPPFDIKGYTEFPAKATGNDRFTDSPTLNDWYETVKLNYGVNYNEGHQKQFSPIPDTWYKMLDILSFWASKGVDGFRCDMAEMVPVEFWNWAIIAVKNNFPEIIFIAEIYQPAEYRDFLSNGKFDFLYDKVGMYEMLRNVTSKNFPVRDITNAWQSLGGIENQMLNFLENHDEQRIASGFFSGNGMYAQPAMIVAATLTKAPVMIYAGQELGEMGMDSEGFSGIDGRTSIFDYWSPDTLRAWCNNGKFDMEKLSEEQCALREFYAKLLNITISEQAITNGLMYDLEFANFNNPKFNSHEQFAYFRKFNNELLLIVLNFHDQYLETEVRLPREAFQYLGIKEGTQYSCRNLLNDNEEIKSVNLSSNRVFQTEIPAWRGKIFKLIAQSEY